MRITWRDIALVGLGAGCIGGGISSLTDQAIPGLTIGLGIALLGFAIVNSLRSASAGE